MYHSYYVKHDVIHKTGSTYRIATPAEEDRATAIGNMLDMVKIGRVVLELREQTDRHRPTHSNTLQPSQRRSSHRYQLGY